MFRCTTGRSWRSASLPWRPRKADLRHHRPGLLGQDHALEVHQSHAGVHSRRTHAGARSRWPDGTSPPSATCTNCAAAGMAFPLPIGLPLSIYENVAYAPRRAGLHDPTSWTSWWSAASGRQCSGTRCATGWTCWARSFPAGSSNSYARPCAFPPAGDPLPGRVLDCHRSGYDDED